MWRNFERIFNEPFAIDYRLTTKCNYSCWYCTDLHNNNNNFIEVDLYKIAYLLHALDRQVVFFLYGGEPTIHPEFESVVRMIDVFFRMNRDKGWLEIQTNLSLPYNKLERIVEGTSHTKWLVSYHHGQTRDLRKFVEKCEMLHEYEVLDMVSVMYQDYFAVETKSIYKMLKAKGINTELLPLLCGSVHEEDEHPYKELDAYCMDGEVLKMTQGEYIRRPEFIFDLGGARGKINALDLWHKRMNIFTGMNCNVSKERIIIDYNGSCYGCFNELFEPDIKPKLNLFRDPVEKIDEYVENMDSMVCPFKKCFFEFGHKKWSD